MYALAECGIAHKACFYAVHHIHMLKLPKSLLKKSASLYQRGKKKKKKNHTPTIFSYKVYQPQLQCLQHAISVNKKTKKKREITCCWVLYRPLRCCCCIKPIRRLRHLQKSTAALTAQPPDCKNTFQVYRNRAAQSSQGVYVQHGATGSNFQFRQEPGSRRRSKELFFSTDTCGTSSLLSPYRLSLSFKPYCL